jgi:hypothetical protein
MATEATTWKAFPLEGVSYANNNTYGSVPLMGNNSYVVYSGTGNSADIAGLDATKTYQFTVLEGYNNSTTGNNAVYKYGGRSNAIVNMAAASVSGTNATGGIVAVYPNPAGTEMTLENTDVRLQGTTAVMTDAQGRAAMTIRVSNALQTVDIRKLAVGVYYLRFSNGVSVRMIKR